MQSKEFQFQPDRLFGMEKFEQQAPPETDELRLSMNELTPDI